MIVLAFNSVCLGRNTTELNSVYFYLSKNNYVYNGQKKMDGAFHNGTRKTERTVFVTRPVYTKTIINKKMFLQY